MKKWKVIPFKMAGEQYYRVGREQDGSFVYSAYGTFKTKSEAKALADKLNRMQNEWIGED